MVLIQGSRRSRSSFTVKLTQNKKDQKITVVVPTLNEERFVSKVIENIPKNFVDEVLVVDGFSSDETIEKAKRAGADKILFQKGGKGKGNALVTGVKHAQGDIIVFWDADIKSTKKWMFPKITDPVLNGADFVKVNYSQTPGRVACLMAIPILKKLFPEAAKFGQPLSGEVAFKKDLINKVDIEPHFGAEVGMLIDAVMNKYKTKEVDLKAKEHKHQTLRQLTSMSGQIMETVLDRAEKYNRIEKILPN